MALYREQERVAYANSEYKYVDIIYYYSYVNKKKKKKPKKITMNVQYLF